jgi:Sulfotransferase family
LTRRDFGPLFLFVHIPKTAGSSFRLSLIKELTPEYNISIDKDRGLKTRDEAFGTAVDHFLERAKAETFRFASGHLKMPEVVHIRRSLSREVNLITMLRDPVERVISEFRYQSTPAHPQWREFTRSFPRFEDFIEHPRARNKMIRHLSLRGESTDAVIDRVDAEFALVGIVESYARSLQLCSAIVGRTLPHDVKERVTAPTSQNSIDLSNTVRARVRELNAADHRLWVHFKDKLENTGNGT